jgi:CHAT domain
VIAEIRALAGHEQFGGGPDPAALHETLGKTEDWLYLLGSPWGTVSLVIRGDGTQDCCLILGLTRAQVDRFRHGLTRLDAPNVSQRSRNARALEVAGWLADALWDRLHDDLGLRAGALTVFPGGNFAALPVEPARLIDRDRRSRPDRPVKIFPSATLLARSLGGRGVKLGTALVVSDPGLPGAREDLAIVRRFFGEDKVTSYIAAEAGTRDLLAEMTGASLIHFASHGEANLLDPQLSALKLGGGKVLTVGQLWDMNLGSARLAVVGTCQSATAGGSLVDELMTFPTVLLRAGAGTVLATLWSVGDTAASKLLEMFYAELVKGTEPASALRECQTRLMVSDAAEVGPGDWAAFVCFG